MTNALGNRSEHLCGAIQEPLLALIPREDAVAHWSLLERLFGVNARGFYLTEFTWEPHLPTLIASTGLEWLPLPITEKGLGGKPRDLSLGWIAQPPEGWGANAEG